jgi:hypothetical protein
MTTEMTHSLQAAERFTNPRTFDLRDFVLRDQAAATGRVNRFVHRFLRHPCNRTIEKGAADRRQRNRTIPRSFGITDVGIVERDTGGNTDANPATRGRKRQVATVRSSGAESMDSERRLMREDAFSSRPKPNDDEPLVLALADLHEAIDAPADRHDAACAHMLDEELGGVASARRLVRAEMPLLRQGDIDQLRPASRCFRHAGTIAAGLFSRCR